MERPHGIELLDSFANHLTVARGLKPATVVAHAQAVRAFLGLAGRDPASLMLPAPFDPASVDKRALEIYLTYLRRERHLAPSSIAGQLSALRGFFAWLEAEGRIERNPARSLRVSVPKSRGQAVEGEVDAVRRMLTGPAKSLRELRLQLLVELIYGGGLKPGVCFGITSMELEPRRNVLRIRTPDGEQAILSSPDGLQRARAYLDERSRILAKATGDVPGDAPFWITGTGRAISAGGMSGQISRAMERAGLIGGPATLRRLAARHFRESGADVRSVRRFLGAKRLSRLDELSPPGYAEVAAAFRDAHPRQS